MVVDFGMKKEEDAATSTSCPTNPSDSIEREHRRIAEMDRNYGGINPHQEVIK